jgi:hypothetical protein
MPGQRGLVSEKTMSHPVTPPGDGEQTGADEIMAPIERAITLGHQGRRPEARQAFAEIWAEIADHGDPLYRCVLAHHLADVQDDPDRELDWDLRALEAAGLITDARAAAAGVTGPVTTFYPSLHLNLGEDYRKLRDRTEARRHLALGQQAAASLNDDPYGVMIIRGLTGLAKRLSH